jgi:hypothetical protein
MNNEIYKTKIVYDGFYTPTFYKIGDFVKKYFNNNDLIIVADAKKGFYNFKFGYKRKYVSNIEEINKKYKIYMKNGYWILKGSDE